MALYLAFVSLHVDVSVNSSKQLLYLISLFSVIAWSESNFLSFTDIKHFCSGNVQIIHCNSCQYELVGLLLWIIIHLYFYLHPSLSLSPQLSDLTCVNDACLRAGKVCGSILGQTSAETAWGASREMRGDSACGRLCISYDYELRGGGGARSHTQHLQLPNFNQDALELCALVKEH